jgi:transcription termination factor NusB
VYLNSAKPLQNVIEDFEQDIHTFRVSLETLREEQRQHQLQICKIVYTQQNDIDKCYQTNVALID